MKKKSVGLHALIFCLNKVIDRTRSHLFLKRNDGREPYIYDNAFVNRQTNIFQKRNPNISLFYICLFVEISNKKSNWPIQLIFFLLCNLFQLWLPVNFLFLSIVIYPSFFFRIQIPVTPVRLSLDLFYGASLLRHNLKMLIISWERGENVLRQWKNENIFTV